ncbi:vomeronasal type-1 receptor 4-like [Orycteropus afer afer]|uniref:Vomeronasal type-1 receptor 4-like n=1 Tax=Orycteropus afer afer TaxID=1230840 RepID=A0AC54Z625_ORYAF|nr:vomeronasal type-1 receptor 4-like [Orycteropus afer afer]
MDLKIGLIFLFQIIVGILGNFSLLLRYIFLDLSGYKLRSMDSIVRNLTVANILLILSRGIPETVAAFAWKDVLHGFACTLVFYVHRVARGVSMATTCLLTVFQAITISPRNSKWAKLKGKAPKYIGPSTALCWVLYSLINIRVLLFMFGKSENVTENKYSGHCSQLSYNTITESLYQALVACLDVLCLGLMFWSSVSMVAILQRHKKQVQHIHRSSPSLRASPETRATQTILVLVSTFVSIYALSSSLPVSLYLNLPQGQ